MKHSYIIFWEDTDPVFGNEKDSRGPGWYCQVSNFAPWGPFETIPLALESMLMEWPKYENILGEGCSGSCDPGDCIGSCDDKKCGPCNINCCDN